MLVILCFRCTCCFLSFFSVNTSAVDCLERLVTERTYCVSSGMENHTTVTVTEALVLRRLLEDRGRITESIRIMVLVDRMKQK